MESTEKKLPGKAIVIGILLLATVGTGLTWMRYTAQAPSTTNCRLVSERIVMATFNARAARNIREGTKAIVTFESSPARRFSGTVQSLQTEDSKVKAVIVLDEIPANANLETPCEVTVDTSVVRELLKAD
jgi:multidrug resistance efflux pump